MTLFKLSVDGEPDEVTPDTAFHAELLKHPSGRELFTKLREFISLTWDLDTKASSLCVNEAVLVIEAQMQRLEVVGHRKSQGGLGICRMEKVVKFIDASLDQRISISELATLVGLSSSQFQRAFKESFGEAVHMYLVKQRVERAKSMFLTSQTNSAEVALACGFADQSHMTRMFKRIVGEAPNTWRRSRMLR